MAAPRVLANPAWPPLAPQRPSFASDFPQTPLLDTFGSSLDTSLWQTPWLDVSSLDVNAGFLEPAGAAGGAAAWIDSFGPDCEVYVGVAVLPPPGTALYLDVRRQTLGAVQSDGYELQVIPSTSTWSLRKVVFGSTTSIKTMLQPFSAGDSMGMRVVGDTLSVYYLGSGSTIWVSLGSIVDTSFTNVLGHIGLEGEDTTQVTRWDSFGGGSLSPLAISALPLSKVSSHPLGLALGQRLFPKPRLLPNTGNPLTQSTEAPYEANQAIAATDSDPYEAVQGITGTGSEPLEATQPIQKVGSDDSYEANQGVRKIGSADSYEATQGIAGTNSDPWETLKALTMTSPDSFESVQSLTATKIEVWESLIKIASVGNVSTYEMLQGIASSGSDPWDVLLALVKTASEPYEVTKSISASQSDPYEENQGISASMSDPHEALKSISANGSLSWESLFSTGKTVLVPYEALKAISATGLYPWEADAVLGVTQTASLPYDGLQALAIARGEIWETSVAISRNSSDSYEAAQGISAAKSDPFEALQKLAATLSLPVEALILLSSLSLLPWDATGVVHFDISQTALLPLDVLSDLAIPGITQVDAQKNLNISRPDPYETLIRTSKAGEFQAESLIAITNLTTLPIEVAISLVAKIIAPWESAGKVPIVTETGLSLEGSYLPPHSVRVIQASPNHFVIYPAPSELMEGKTETGLDIGET